MLDDLDKGWLTEMGVTAVGDRIAILKRAAVVVKQDLVGLFNAF